ncbi:MAG: type II toxin-antitoxin system HicB family antitoxin [Patescibacteria group bacterium]
MKDTYLYPIIIESCEEGGFFTSCPVVQGAHAEGETYAETVENLESVMKHIFQLVPHFSVHTYSR